MSKPMPLPSDEAAEMDLLARIYQSGTGAIHLVADTLRPEHFFNTLNESLYAAALATSDSGKQVELGAAYAWLKDRQKLSASDGSWTTVRERLLADVEFHVPRLKLEEAKKRILEKYALRRLIAVAEGVAIQAHGDTGDVGAFLEEAEASIHGVAQTFRDGFSAIDVYSLYDLVHGMAEEMSSGAERQFVTSGIPDLDDDLGGFEVGFVSVLGAPTNWGKSNAVIMIADEADKAGKSVLVVTCEDPPKLYTKRFVARRGRINAGGLKNYNLTEADHGRLLQLAQDVSVRPRLPWIVNANGRPIENVVPRVRRICQTHHIDLIVWDYLQAAKCRERFRDKRERVEYIAREMTDVTKQSGAAGLIVSQFRRLDVGEEPTIHHLKESGDIENGAEAVLLGFNDKLGKPRIRLGKNKDGAKNEDYGLWWEPVSASFQPGNRITRDGKAA